jgi:uncharacterized protein YjeT (DUF2065 family)
VLAWSDLLAALALYLGFEGIAPFVNPAGMKRALAMLLAVPDPQLRVAGLGSIGVGLLLLFFVRSAGAG